MKNLEISMLLDFYSNLLTDKQRDMLDLYYNQDLSLAEISESIGITRQAVRDSIKRGEQVLLDLENKLKVAHRFKIMQNNLDKVLVQVDNILNYNQANSNISEINKYAKNIQQIVKELSD